jgi:nitronate monooxygenase
VKEIQPAGALVERFRREYAAARARLGARSPLVNPAWEKVLEAAAAE